MWNKIHFHLLWKNKPQVFLTKWKAEPTFYKVNELKSSFFTFLYGEIYMVRKMQEQKMETFTATEI